MQRFEFVFHSKLLKKESDLIRNLPFECPYPDLERI